MNPCFADTFFFIALLFENDEAHAQAQALAGQLSGRMYTTVWVLTELADAMSSPDHRKRFLPFLQFLRGNPLVTIVQSDQAIFDRGVALYDQRRDKDWSLTDCISFIVMQDHAIADALTGDHHFDQAGFNVMIK
jgi:predicted nucleic acid-binding protein